MKKTYFINGVNLNKNKKYINTEIIEIETPKIVRIYLQQHIGDSSVPVVKVGEKVKQGEIIAKSSDELSSDIHSSVNGMVKKISDEYVEISEIEEKENQFVSSEILKDPPCEENDILEKIKKAGIVDRDGVPCYLKISKSLGKNIKSLVISGVECEPCFSANSAIMQNSSEELMVGARLVNKILGIQNAIIVIDKNNKKIFEVLDYVTRRYIGVNVKKVASIYPKENEKILLKNLFNVEISSEEQAIDYGYLTLDVSTIYAIYEAVMLDKPCFEKVISVTADYPLSQTGNYKLKLGTVLEDFIKILNIDKTKYSEIFMNGQIVGEKLNNLKRTITKNDTSLYFSEKNSVNEFESPCIKCNECANQCPTYLQPFNIVKNYKYGQIAELEKINLDNCIECGICSYVCPAKIPILKYIKLVKTNTKDMKVKVDEEK